MIVGKFNSNGSSKPVRITFFSSAFSVFRLIALLFTQLFLFCSSLLPVYNQLLHSVVLNAACSASHHGLEREPAWINQVFRHDDRNDKAV